jgi:hypothetical protein
VDSGAAGSFRLIPHELLEISFTMNFYKPQPLRTLEEISADILAIEKEADGLLKVGAKP